MNDLASLTFQLLGLFALARLGRLSDCLAQLVQPMLQSFAVGPLVIGLLAIGLLALESAVNLPKSLVDAVDFLFDLLKRAVDLPCGIVLTVSQPFPLAPQMVGLFQQFGPVARQFFRVAFHLRAFSPLGFGMFSPLACFAFGMLAVAVFPIALATFGVLTFTMFPVPIALASFTFFPVSITFASFTIALASFTFTTFGVSIALASLTFFAFAFAVASFAFFTFTLALFVIGQGDLIVGRRIVGRCVTPGSAQQGHHGHGRQRASP